MSARSAGSRTHSSICMAMSEPSSRCTSIERSGDSSTLAPSICERKVTACSVTLRRSDSDITWKPPESVSIGPPPAGEFLQAAERCDPLRARPQHQMIGIAEHDIGAGIAHLAPVHALHRAGGADRHEGRRPHHAMRRGQPAECGPGRRSRAVRNDWERPCGSLWRNKRALFNRPFDPVWTDFPSKTPLTAAQLSRISPPHERDHQTHRENQSTLGGLGSRARVVERSHHLNRSPA